MSWVGHKQAAELWDGTYSPTLVDMTAELRSIDQETLYRQASHNEFKLGEALVSAINQVEWQQHHRHGMSAVGSIGRVIHDWLLHRRLDRLLEQWNLEVDDWRTSQAIPLVPKH